MNSFLEWQSYNLQVDQIFLLVLAVVFVLLAVFWIIFRLSAKIFGKAIRTGAGLAMIILVVLWIISWFS